MLWCLGQERTTTSQKLDAGDSALHKVEIADTVIDVCLVVNDVGIGVV